MLQKRGGQEDTWDCRTENEEMADSALTVEDVELYSGFCLEADSDLSLAGVGSVASDGCPETEELDWFVNTEPGESVFTSEGLTGDGRSQTREDGKMKADSVSVENEETEAEWGVEVDDLSEREEVEIEQVLDVCLRPLEESGGHVRISLEEVERYYRFSRCCHWLCGKCQMFKFPDSFVHFVSQKSLLPCHNGSFSFLCLWLDFLGCYACII